MNTRRLSITARLTVLFAMTSASVLVGLGLLIAQALKAHFASEDYVTLEERMELVTRIAAQADADSLAQSVEAALRNHPGFIARIDLGGRPIYATDGFDFSVASGQASGRAQFSWLQDGQQYRGMLREAQEPARPRILLGLSTAIHDHFMVAFTHTLIAFVIAATLISGVLGWWVARKGTAPMRAMARSARAVAHGDWHERMEADAVPIEMAELATQLNTMLDRLQQDLKRLSDFSSDIAHELRTPLSNMMTQTHVILSKEADASTYREALLSNAEEMQCLARMTADMLYLAKTENGLNLPTCEPVDLSVEMASVVDFYDALADEKGLRVRTWGEAHVQGDRLMIRRALSNLLSNAVRHAVSGSVVDVAITCEAEQVVLRMANHGQDIAPADLPKVFNRFYRADQSRQRRDSNGTGLGLSITKAIMQAHRGSVSVESGEGLTVFTLSFGVGAACTN